MDDGGIMIGRWQNNRRRFYNLVRPAWGYGMNGERLCYIIFDECGQYLGPTVRIRRFSGEGFYKTDQGFLYGFALLIFHAHHEKRIARIALFHQAIKFTFAFKRSVYTLEAAGVGHVGNSDGNFNEDGFGWRVFPGIQLFDHRLLVLVGEPPKEAIVPDHMNEDEDGEQYREESFHAGPA